MHATEPPRIHELPDKRRMRSSRQGLRPAQAAVAVAVALHVPCCSWPAMRLASDAGDWQEVQRVLGVRACSRARTGLTPGPERRPPPAGPQQRVVVDIHGRPWRQLLCLHEVHMSGCCVRSVQPPAQRPARPPQSPALPTATRLQGSRQERAWPLEGKLPSGAVACCPGSRCPPTDWAAWGVLPVGAGPAAFAGAGEGPSPGMSLAAASRGSDSKLLILARLGGCTSAGRAACQ